MPIITIPFVAIGLFAKILNNKVKKNQIALPVHTNRQPQFQQLIDIVLNNLNETNEVNSDPYQKTK